MEPDIELAPFLLDRVEDRFQLAFRLEVQRHEDLGTDLLGQRLDVRLGLVVEIGDGEVRAEGAESLGAAPGDRLIVGDSGNQRLLALEQWQGRKINHVGFSSSSIALSAQDGERVAGDHQLLVGGDDVTSDARAGTRD